MVFLLVYAPLAFIQYRRLSAEASTKIVDRTVKAITWIFTIIFLLPIAEELYFEFYSFSFFGDVAFPNNIIYFFDYYFLDFGMYEIKEIGTLVLHILPYMVVTGLLYWSLRASKGLKEV